MLQSMGVTENETQLSNQTTPYKYKYKYERACLLICQVLSICRHILLINSCELSDDLTVIFKQLLLFFLSFFFFFLPETALKNAH